MLKVFCSICGEDLEKCKCKKEVIKETKVIEPEETKSKKRTKKKTE